MSLPIHWHDEAINDLFELVVYIAERDPQAARRLRIRIEAAVSSTDFLVTSISGHLYFLNVFLASKTSF